MCVIMSLEIVEANSRKFRMEASQDHKLGVETEMIHSVVKPAIEMKTPRTHCCSKYQTATEIIWRHRSELEYGD